MPMRMSDLTVEVEPNVEYATYQEFGESLQTTQKRKCRLKGGAVQRYRETNIIETTGRVVEPDRLALPEGDKND